MKKVVSLASYHNSFVKLCLDYSLSLMGLIISSPLILLTSILIKLGNGGPVIFAQKRVGKNQKRFSLIKFRTMRKGAEKEKSRYEHLNEADGPVFKIYNDPRYTKFGKVLARTGLDELPQLVNVLEGNMSLVGPRPLPDYEAKKLTKKQKLRELIKPGITSSWVVEGSHSLSFKKWMELDKDYVVNASFVKDIQIIIKTVLLSLRQISRF